MAGTYTETGINLNKNAVELWMEIGVIIDPASGVALTISGDYCKVKGEHLITPDSAVGLLVSGTGCVVSDGSIVGGTSCVSVTGIGCAVNNYSAGAPSVNGFSLSGAQTRLTNCATVGTTTSYGYHVSGGADNGAIKYCTSAGHQTSSFYIDTGSAAWTVLNCSSGAGDGRFKDVDEANVWTNFSFANIVEAELDITQGSADTYEYNLFTVTGTVKITSLYAVVEDALTGSNTNVYMDIFSANGSEVLSKNTTLTLGAAVKGSFLAKLDKADKVLSFFDATGTPGMVDEIDAKSEGFRLIEDRTGGAHVATYVRFIHTTDGASTGEMDVYITFEPESDDGWLAVTP